MFQQNTSERFIDSSVSLMREAEPFAMQKKLPVFQSTWALFLDIDGTIADIALKPDQAFIPPETLQTLARLRSLIDTVAFVSGRNLHSIDSLTSPYSFPAAGQHGLEIRQPDGQIKLFAASPENMPAIIEEIEGLQRCYPKLIIEKKGLSVAVHYRLAPKLEGVVKHFLEVLTTAFPDINLQMGKMVAEIQLRGGGKGRAIENMMRMPPFKGCVPVFIGDDLTDHAGFEAVNRMGGISIQVGAGDSAAQYSIDTPAHVREWLNGFLGHRQHQVPMTLKRGFAPAEYILLDKEHGK